MVPCQVAVYGANKLTTESGDRWAYKDCEHLHKFDRTHGDTHTVTHLKVIIPVVHVHECAVTEVQSRGKRFRPRLTRTAMKADNAKTCDM